MGFLWIKLSTKLLAKSRNTGTGLWNNVIIQLLAIAAFYDAYA